MEGAVADEAIEQPAQNPYGASIDSSRIVRSDYAYSAYAKLGLEAQALWRQGYGTCPSYDHGGWDHFEKGKKTGSGGGDNKRRKCTISGCDHGPVYQQCGLILTGNKSRSEYVDRACRNVEALGFDVQGLQGWKEIAGMLEHGRTPTEPADGRGGAGWAAEARVDVSEADRAYQMGETGYVNWNSGWADAARAMYNVLLSTREAARARNRDPRKKGEARFVRGTVTQLLFASADSDGGDCGDRPSTVTGVAIVPSAASPSLSPPSVDPLSSNPAASKQEEENIHADLTILATGAHTCALLDLRSQIKATGQRMAYLPLTAAQAATLKDMPLLFNLSTGMFLIPPLRIPISPSSPSPSTTGEPLTHILKVARHDYGYVNPVSVRLSGKARVGEGGREDSGNTFTASIPHPSFSQIPPQDLRDLKAFLRGTLPHIYPPDSSPLPSSIDSRPNANASSEPAVFSGSRLCWYTDTPNADYLITYHPRHRGLFLATGGSGHGFKFLPVLGHRIVEVLEIGANEESILENGPREEAEGQKKKETGTLGDDLRQLWRWKHGASVDWVGTEDGSRNGRAGVTVAEAFAAGCGGDSGGDSQVLRRRNRDSKL